MSESRRAAVGRYAAINGALNAGACQRNLTCGAVTIRTRLLTWGQREKLFRLPTQRAPTLAKLASVARPAAS